MRHGLSDASRLRRFEFETQLLARLQHPGIAQVFAADVFEDRGAKKPFFVMEYVADAATLTQFAERTQLPLTKRVELLATVCEAVGYGHHQGVVHCDLKPDNLLVSPTGAAKVIDFGIARAADRETDATTLHTRTYSLAGTLPYMSPEQAAGAPAGLDARSDVYALGVICYELLSGALPIDVVDDSIPVAVQRITQDEPTRLGRHDTQLRGDLEIITAKCLAKERDQRYEDATELARDLRRYLANEPIAARRPTATYQLRKFARRHRGFVAGATLALVAILTGAAVAVQQAIVATHGEAASRWQAYRSSIAAASAALVVHDVAQARLNLQDAPAEHRHWEWHHLMARLDGSFASLSPPGIGAIGEPQFVDRGGRVTFVVVRDGHANHYDLDSGELVHRGPALFFASDYASGTVATLDTDRLTVTRNGATVASWPCAELGPAAVHCQNIDVAHGGGWVLVSSEAFALRIELATGHRQQIEVNRNSTGVTADAISPRGDAVVATGLVGMPGVWRHDADAPVALEHAGSVVRSVAFDRAGGHVAMGLQDTTVGIWDVATAERVIRADGHVHAVTAAAFSPDEELLLTAGLDRTLRLWRTGGLAPLATLVGHDRGIRHVAVAPSSSTVVTCGEEGVVKLWDAGRSAEPGTLRGHTSLVFPTRFSPDGELVASASADRSVRIWATATEECVTTIPTRFASVVDVAFNADSSRLVVASRNSCFAWDLDRGKALAPGAMMSLIVGSLRNISFADDGVRVLIPHYHEDGTIPAWHSDTGRTETAPVDDLFHGTSPSVSPDRRFAVLSVPMTASGKAHRADSDSASTLVVFDRSTKRLVATPPIAGAFTWLPESGLLAARRADEPGSVVLLDVASGRTQGEIRGHSDRIYAMTATRDGSRLLTSGRDGIRVWTFRPSDQTPLQRGELIVRLTGHTSFVWSISRSPTAAMFVSGSGDRTVRLVATHT